MPSPIFQADYREPAPHLPMKTEDSFLVELNIKFLNCGHFHKDRLMLCIDECLATYGDLPFAPAALVNPGLRTYARERVRLFIVTKGETAHTVPNNRLEKYLTFDKNFHWEILFSAD